MERAKIMPDRFDLLKRLGSGNFGEVWLAFDPGLGVQRAVKIIPPDRIPDKTNFFREAQVLKAAEHSNVVKVEDTGTLDDGRVYVAMQYMRRGSLDDEAKGSYVVTSRARRIMIDVLRGLEWAHAKGILHRDIKPGNILIGDNRAGVLSDFGLAIARGVTDPVGMTDYVYVLHLAPEVNTPRDWSIAADIFACGVTLYRLLNGDRYLPAISPASVASAIQAGSFPDRNAYREFVPRSLRQLVNKAIHVDPSKRFASASDMRHALEQVNVCMNWEETPLVDGQRWNGSWGVRHLVVERRRDSQHTWSVEYRKGSSPRQCRRVVALCKTGLGARDSVILVRKILQDAVLGRRG